MLTTDRKILPRETTEVKTENHFDYTNVLANNKERLQDEDFYDDKEDSDEECELFKHNVYEGNVVLSTDEETSFLEILFDLLTKRSTYNWWLKLKILLSQK